MKNKEKKQCTAPSIRRLVVSIVLTGCILMGVVFVIPWTIPYDRLEHLYGLGFETIEAGHPGGEFILYCAPINGSPKVDLLVNGKYYATTECIAKEQYKVVLGPELFEKPGRLELTLKETFALPVSLRSNTVSLIVQEPKQDN